MRTIAAFVALVGTLGSNPVAAQDGGKEPSREEKASSLATKMEKMREDYQELLAQCWGKGYYEQDPLSGEPVWRLSEAPDPGACEMAVSLKADYRKAYKDLLKLDPRRVLFDDIPRAIDRS